MAHTIVRMEQWLQTLPDMALFVEVGRTGGCRLAGLRLGVPASTVSRRIAAMETRLGLKRFHRTTCSVTLAPAARPYYERCLRAMESAEQVDMDLSSRARDLLRDPVDLAFRLGKPLDDRVVARRIAEVAAGLYAAPELLRRIGPITRVSQLAQLPCLNLLTSAGPMPWKVGSNHWPAAPGPHARRLVRLLADQAVPGWPLYVVTASRAVPARIAELIAHMRQALRKEPLSRTTGT